MSPRSDEYLEAARRRLAHAHHSLGGGFYDGAASAAYYAMFHAAKAALSEADTYAKTHSGVWSRFSELYVRTGLVPGDLASVGINAQGRREQVEYDFKHVTRDEASALMTAAERFVQVIEDHFAE